MPEIKPLRFPATAGCSGPNEHRFGTPRPRAFGFRR
jgi:hypothetical protein